MVFEAKQILTGFDLTLKDMNSLFLFEGRTKKYTYGVP